MSKNDVLDLEAFWEDIILFRGRRRAASRQRLLPVMQPKLLPPGSTRVMVHSMEMLDPGQMACLDQEWVGLQKGYRKLPGRRAGSLGEA